MKDGAEGVERVEMDINESEQCQSLYIGDLSQDTEIELD